MVPLQIETSAPNQGTLVEIAMTFYHHSKLEILY